VLDACGHVTDADLAALRTAGFDDEAVVEIIGNIAATIFTNLLNNVAQTEVDVPSVKPGKWVA
jgi:alkylhydroperoxidase family enzyme